VIGARQPPARKFPNLVAARTVRALEVLTFHPASAPALAATLGISAPHARRLLLTLDDEDYLQRGHGTGRQQHTYSPTPRLLALAGQLAARLKGAKTGDLPWSVGVAGPERIVRWSCRSSTWRSLRC
jgi:hypothetical protein